MLGCVAAGGFFFVNGGDIAGVIGVLIKLGPHVEAEGHVFSAHPEKLVHPNCKKVLAMHHHQGTCNGRHGPGFVQGERIVRD